MMQRRMEVITGDYCFNLLNSLVDYCGDARRKLNSNSNNFMYSEDYSPNNIRRLILSGDGARIDFHVSVNGKMSKTRVFSDSERSKMQECLYNEKYKPMTWVLAERVCSSIEEIIICTNNVGGVDLSRELNVEGLLKNYKSSSVNGNNNIKEVISSRYKRLCYFTVVNCSISELISNEEVRNCTSYSSMISETDFVSSRSNIESFKKDDWYNFYGYSSVYSLDRDGSRLNNHFNNVKSKIASDNRQDAIKKIKESRFKEFEDKFNKAYKNYKGVYDCIRKLYVIFSVEGSTYIASDVKMFDISKFESPDKVKSKYDSLESKDKLGEYIKSITISTTSMYSVLVNWFLNGLNTIKSKYPLTFDILLDTIDKNITIPPSCSSMELSKYFRNCSMSDSTANVCSSSCIAFITDASVHDMNKYYTKDTWYENFKGGIK